MAVFTGGSTSQTIASLSLSRTRALQGGLLWGFEGAHRSCREVRPAQEAGRVPDSLL